MAKSELQGTKVLTGTDVDWLLGGSFKKDLSINTVFTFSNTSEGKAIVLVIKYISRN